MAFFVRMLMALSFVCFYGCSAEEQKLDHWAVEVKHQDDLSVGKSDDGKNSAKETQTGNKIRRSLSPSDRTDSVTMMNNLRRTVGSSNMPYMTYSDTGESDAVSWTFFCNFDKAVNARNDVYWMKHIISGSITIPNILRDNFNKYSRELSSVYLTSLGCDQRQCSLATYKGSLYKDARLTLCVFQAGSQYNSEENQFKTGEACTECNSGSFWCDYGLCRGDCSAGDSKCYCNSNCLNCADTDRTTCRCRCIEGWTGSRCQTQISLNATTPSCSTTMRVPKMLTTISLNSVASIGTSMFWLAFCAVMALFLGL